MTAKKGKKAARKHGRTVSHPSPIQALVNGQSVGTVENTNQSIGDAARGIATANGLKAYSVRVNGVPVTPEDAAKGLGGVKSIEVFAKDTRG